ncbi:Hypothetical predicted protein, partial [Olea europaea subsp. europaea]
RRPKALTTSAGRFAAIGSDYHCTCLYGIHRMLRKPWWRWEHRGQILTNGDRDRVARRSQRRCDYETS